MESNRLKNIEMLTKCYKTYLCDIVEAVLPSVKCDEKTQPIIINNKKKNNALFILHWNIFETFGKNASLKLVRHFSKSFQQVIIFCSFFKTIAT